MRVNLKFNKLFAYSEKNNKYFYTEFSNGINIVHGKNTSGKSTLFLSILYTFGINDGNQYLKSLLSEEVIFRLDCTLNSDEQSQSLTVIRDNETLYISRVGMPLKRFNGINGNNSAEHVKLKHFFNKLFEFSLLLEYKNEYKQAPIEAMFLPYYVSQAVGWVYLRKSFSSFDFYRNFKEDYLDYYLGLDPSVNRVKRHELQAKLKKKQDEIALIAAFETKDQELQLAKLSEEELMKTSQHYVQAYSDKHAKLTEDENRYVLKSNELSFYEERQKTLRKVKSGQAAQKPSVGNCPTCAQTLPIGIAETYKFLQEENDTVLELNTVKGKINDVQSEINSLQKTIQEQREVIAREYTVLNKYIHEGITYDIWLKNKAHKELIDTLHKKIGQLTIEEQTIAEELKQYKSEAEIESQRDEQSGAFTALFLIYLEQLGVQKPEEQRYTKLYLISSFPSQGVELHKTTMAYHFAFNHLISTNLVIHRLPFLLDAIFKEDLEPDSKMRIMKFISKNRPKDTQTIFSIAQTTEQQDNSAHYNATYFNNEAKLIQIGSGTKVRSFLQNYDGSMDDYIKETLDVITGVNESL